jgi:deazaflavin-dependent oxidoreductase (nitroreductase family)
VAVWPRVPALAAAPLPRDPPALRPGGAGEAAPGEEPGEAEAGPGRQRRCGLVLTIAMPVEGDYEPSTAAWVRDQVELYEGSGGTQGTTLRDTGLPVVIVTNKGAKSGKVRKTPVMRVEHDGRYAMVASKGGAPEHPLWYYSVRVNPLVELQDGADKQDYRAREISGGERAEWWDRAVAAYPPYAEYQEKTTRLIPVFVLEPTGGD